MDMPVMKFGVGQSVPRVEDPILLRGEGFYADDDYAEGEAFGVMLRSQHAHGELTAIDAGEALAMPGVLAIYTYADLEAAGYKPLPCIAPGKNADGSPMIKPPRPALANGRVRHVGDPIAFVVAETRAQARDAADCVMVDIEPLASVTDPVAASAEGAPQIWPEAPGNLAVHYQFGDAGRVADAFASAAHITRLEIDNHRVVVAAIEPRAGMVRYDGAAKKWTFRIGCQGAFPIRNGLANVLNVEHEQVRVTVGNVGGSFGMKSQPYPEYVCMAHAARALGRSVRWRDERSESFLSDNQGRGCRVTAELALDAGGLFQAVRISGHADLGGYLSQVGPGPQNMNIVKNICSLYRTPAVEVSMKCMFTNATPVGAYRGAGRPEANYFMERLVDQAAHELSVDRIDLRRRNLVPPTAMPFKAASGMIYDSGDFPRVLDAALVKADWDGYATRQAESKTKGLLRGRGLSSYLEVTAPSSKEMGGISFDEDGGVTISTGTLDYGQGHAAPFAQVLVDQLGVPFEDIRLMQGDSDFLIAGGGTGGSKSMISSGGAIIEAAGQVIAKGRELAAHLLETAAADIEFRSGRFEVAGTDRSIGLLELVGRLRGGLDLPEGMPDSLDTALVHETGDCTFPNGCHVTEIELDPETGVITVESYIAVDDFGVVVNPLLVEGQVHGGVVQGLGQVFMEQSVHDDEGQPLTGSFMDYAMPRADQIPNMAIDYVEVPAQTNALGAKGCGEAGCSGALGALMNAVVDALSEYGIRHIDMPVTPERVWRAIQGARG
jgi:carbon-monoxide dehydrogenase large subunit